MERKRMAQVATYFAVAFAAFLYWQSTRNPTPPRQPDMPPPPPPSQSPVFPRAASTVLPDPARFFAPELLSAPLPTNSFFQNFALNDGDQPEYIHPYSIKSAAGGLTVCYPKSLHSPSFHAQNFVADLTVSSPSAAAAAAPHRIAAFDDLSVTLDFSPSLRAFLVRGSPFVTVATAGAPADISLASVHAFLEAAPRDDTLTRWLLRMNSGQTFLLYASAPIHLSMSSVTQLAAPGFSGVIRVAFLPDAAMEAVLDRYSDCFLTAGEAALNRPFSVDYTWRTQGSGTCSCSPTRSTSACSPRTAASGCSRISGTGPSTATWSASSAIPGLSGPTRCFPPGIPPGASARTACLRSLPRCARTLTTSPSAPSRP